MRYGIPVRYGFKERDIVRQSLAVSLASTCTHGLILLFVVNARTSWNRVNRS
jgi:hypothetical protein